MATRAGAGPVNPQVHVMLDGRESKDGSLASRASIHIAFCHVDKVGLGEQTFLPRCGGEWLGNVRTDVVQIARPYLRAAEVAPISKNLQLRLCHRVLRLIPPFC